MSGVVISFGTSSKVLINSPLSISIYMGLLSSFTLFVMAAVFGQAICKDYLVNMDQIIFSTPLKTESYLMGRFLGALAFMFIISSSIALGIYLASILPFVLPSMVGSNHLSHYLLPMFTVALPNIFIFGSLFFLMGSKAKNMTAIYITAVLLFLLWSVSGQLLKDIDNKVIATLLDPLGLRAVFETFRYWSVDQQSSKHLLFESYYLWNRLFWLGLALAALISSILGFSKSAKTETAGAVQKAHVNVTINQYPPKANRPPDSPGVCWPAAFFRQLTFEINQSVKSIYFLVIALAGVGYMFVTGTQIGKIYGTNTYPVTYTILEVTGGTFSLFILIILTLYIGEAVWRDRDTKIDQIIDALPTPNAVFLGAKYLALVLITTLLLTSVMFSGILIQLAFGYTNFEIGHYFTQLYLIELPHYLNVISLIFFYPGDVPE